MGKVKKNLPPFPKNCIFQKTFFRGNKGDVYNVPARVQLMGYKDQQIRTYSDGKVLDKDVELLVVKNDLHDGQSLLDEYCGRITDLECLAEENKVVRINLIYTVGARFEIVNYELFVEKYYSKMPLNVFQGNPSFEDNLRSAIQDGVESFMKSSDFGYLQYPLVSMQYQEKFKMVKDGVYLNAKAVNDKLKAQRCGVQLQAIELKKIEILEEK